MSAKSLKEIQQEEASILHTRDFLEREMLAARERTVALERELAEAEDRLVAIRIKRTILRAGVPMAVVS